MLNPNQEKYLNTIPEGAVFHFSPFDSRAKRVAETITKQIENALPRAKVLLLSSLVLEIGGQNDIDISVVSVRQDEYKQKLTELFGTPTKEGAGLIHWDFEKEGYPVEIYLTKTMPTEQIQTLEILKNNPTLLKEYETLKKSADGKPFREYMRRKYKFFNRITTSYQQTTMHPHIPQKYKKFWVPYKTNKTLFHLTTKTNFENIKKLGYLEPRDPSPKYWSGMKAVFLADPDDPLYADSLKHVLAHVKQKHEELIRLHIRTKNKLYKSIDPERTFQVMSLEPIDAQEIEKVEEL